MEVTELGMTKEVRLVQPWNAKFSMEVTEFGMVMETRLAQSLKAEG